MSNRNISQEERSIAAYLSRFPVLKKYLKYLYRSALLPFYRQKNSFQTAYSLERFTVDGQESFFGYYDKCPAGGRDGAVLFHSLDPSREGFGICLHDPATDRSRRLATTLACNLQQGARLHWLNDDEIIFNDFDTARGAYCSRRYDIRTAREQRLPFAVYDTCRDVAVTLRFERLNWLRPDYGYHPGRGQAPVAADDAADGVFRLDLTSGAASLLVSLEDLKTMAPHPQGNRRHFVNHLMISPGGSKCLFTYSVLTGTGKTDRLVLYDFHAQRARLVGTFTMVSHCNWIAEDRIVGFMSSSAHAPGYYVYNLRNELAEPLGPPELSRAGDGHPSVCGGRLVTDSYPDRAGMKTLQVMDLADSTLEVIGRFFERPTLDSSWRCDLHPRWSHGCSAVFFDSVHSGRRYLYRMNYEPGR